MTAKHDIPKIGDFVRHHPTGLLARVENIRGTHRNIFGILFADGVKEIAHLVELDFDLTDEEQRRLSAELPSLDEQQLSQR